MHLVIANLVRAQLVRPSAEVLREIFDNRDVRAYGILRVIATLEFVQH